jgi:hypothetical protein
LCVMNPYDVLGVPSDATASQIKAAYRKAVKKYHPDATRLPDTSMVALVNEAYDLLSDPQRKHAYDTNRYSFVTIVKEEDPRTIYKREFLRKKQEQAEARVKWELALFQRVYKINAVLAIMCVFLILDEALPTVEYQDPPEQEWISDIQGKYKDYHLLTVRTEHFKIAVPFAVNYQYDAKTIVPVKVEASPVFRVPVLVSIPRQEEGEVVFEPLYTLYSYPFPFHYAVLIFASVTLLLRQHSPMAFSLSLVRRCWR